ncbi:hypothetical protein [Methanosarcina sp.]|uniref:hypothetical protein n=1 Tax=Methanosarcina sp. TaxID=2213 RepID=UPI003C70E06E
MKIGIVCKVLILATFLGLAVFSGIFVLVDKEDNIAKHSEKQFVETVSNESSLKGITDTQDNDIVQKVNLQDNPANSQDYWDDSETFIIDIKKFEESAAGGNVNIRLLERNFEIEFDEITVSNGGESCHYSGHVRGVPYSKADFYIYGEVFCGSIEFGDLMYTIAVTSEEYNGKTVHVAFLINWENERDKIKDLLNPLSFLHGSDSMKNLPGSGEGNKQHILSYM